MNFKVSKILIIGIKCWITVQNVLFVWKRRMTQVSRESGDLATHTMQAWRRPVLTNTTREFLCIIGWTQRVYGWDARKLSSEFSKTHTQRNIVWFVWSRAQDTTDTN